MNNTPDIIQEIRAGLNEWRRRTLNVILTIAAAAMTVAVIVLLVDAISKPEQLPAVLIFLACDLFLVGLAVLRRIDVRWRGLGFLLIGYGAGTLALSRGGLAGAGREYLIALPIVGIILIGVRGGLLLTGLSVVIMAVFAGLAQQGVMQDWLARDWLIYDQNPLNLTAWVVEQTYTVLILGVAMALLVLFHRYLMKTLEAERRAKVELNQAHQLLGEYSQSLENKVEQRTAELVRATDEALEARSIAEAASRTKSDFLANMSHEIRTPMNAIMGMTGLLFDTPLSAQQHDIVDTIRDSSGSLLTIVNEILDFSKIEAGRMELEHHAFNLQECLESALDIVAPIAAEKGLELAGVIEPGTPGAILGDSTRLRQILVNLLSNAVKFTEQGEVVVSVRTDTEAFEGHESSWAEPAEIQPSAFILHFAVRDTGIGIPEDRMSRLFQSFSQVDASTTRKYGGSGLGLAISKRLSEMMEGTIWVESRVGQGSIFNFTIRARPTELPRPTYMGSSQPHLSGKRLLIVDDNPTNLQILLAQTRGWGMISIPAASGAEALELLRQAEGQPFDLAILDMTMPEMDGMRLVDEIRQIERAQSGYPLRRLALVMLASLGRSGNDPRLREFSACLSKPVKASQLYNSLVNIFASGTPAPGLADTLPGGVPSGAAGYDTYMADRPPAEVTGPLRILLAEDNSTNQKLAVLMLERMGYRPDVAANGLEVLDALHRQPYDVILMDVLMPEMDGLEATRIIRKEYATLNQPAARTQPAAQDQLAAIDQPAATTQRAVTDQPAATPQPAAEVQPYIIAMTANVLQGDRERCLEAGMSGYLGKPIHFRELAEAILRCKPGESGLPAAPVPGQAAPAAAQRAGPAEILDPAAWSRLQAMLGAKAGEMLPMLIDTFLREAVQLQEEAVQAVEQEKHTDLRRAAHTLKSNAANFGATALAAACLELENIGRNNTVAGAVDLLVKVGIEFEQVKEALLTARGQVVIPHPLPPLPKGEGNSC